MADLNALSALVAKAQATVAAKATLAVVERKAKAAKSTPEREAAQAEASALLAMLEWRSTALVLVFNSCTCKSCSSQQLVPEGLFLYQEHTRLANATRLIRQNESLHQEENLTRRYQYVARSTPFCAMCASSHGFDRHLEKPISPAERLLALQRPGRFVSEWNGLRQQTAPDDERRSALIAAIGAGQEATK